MDKEDVLRERINSLIDNGLLSVEMLQEATGIEKDSLEKFLFENGVKLSSDDMKDSQRRLRLFGISDCLIEGMKVPEDERVKGIIDVWEKQLPYYKNGNVKSRPVYLTKTQAESDLKYKDYCRVKGKNDPKKSKEDRVNPIIQQWDSTETLNSCRENWAKINNEKFEEKGLNIRISHLSLKEQGIDRIPTIHEGAARNMEKNRQ